MEDLSKKIRITHRINDSTLDINQLSNYDLFLSIEEKNLRVAVIDEVQKKCMLLEDYRLQGVGGLTDTITHLNAIQESHLILRAGYWNKIVLIARNGGFTFVPDEFFDPLQVASYLSFHPNITESDIHTFHHKTSHIHSVFTLEQEFLTWAKKSYPNKEIVVMHQADAFMSGAIAEKNAEKQMFVCIENRHMNILLMEGANVLLHNRYCYQSPQDFVYFILFALDEYKLSPDECLVRLYGEISKDSGIFNLLQKYVRNVDFGKRPANLTFSYVFDDVLEHRYYDLYNAYLCFAQ